MTITQGTTTAQHLADDWTAAWNSPDPERLAALFTPDAVYTDLAAGRSFHGHAEIAGFRSMSALLIADLHLEVLDAFGDGHQVAIETTYSGHFRGAPSAFAVRGTTVLRLRDGLIAADTDDYDLTAVLAQSGLPVGWAPAGE
jgi:steroid delta-isomerase-like uncharacterized protein